MKVESFILSIIKKIEALKEGVVAYGYKTGNASMTHVWWEIACSDLDMYLGDERFSTLTRAWMKAAKAKGFKLIFVSCNPDEKKLVKLMEENNLLIDT